MMTRFPLAMLLLLTTGPICSAQPFLCPLEEWMSGTYVLYYCDEFITSCDDEPTANYYYGPPLPVVPYQNCGTLGDDGDCVNEAYLRAKSVPFPGLARPVTSGYEHVLPEPARKRSEAIDLELIINAKLKDDTHVAYAKVFLFRMRHGEAHVLRYVAIEVYPDKIDPEKAMVVTVEPNAKSEHVFGGRFLGKGLLLLTAQNADE